MVDEKLLRQALAKVMHPKLKRPLVEAGMLRDLKIEGGDVTLTLALKNERSPFRKVLMKKIEAAAAGVAGVRRILVTVTALGAEESERLFPKARLPGVEQVKRIVAVASGKGGVGKTTVAVNLALALVAAGRRVGLLDADVYGPSVPLMLALAGEPERDNGFVLPLTKHGLKVLSLGLAAGEEDAFIWRGPLVAKMIRHLLGQVRWGVLDYLVVDLPPGTGDPSITIAQSLPGAFVLMVTTPQEVALADVRRAVTLFRKQKLQIAGFVENMAPFQPVPGAGPIALFGAGGGERISRETGLPLLVSLPFAMELGQGGDTGVPLQISAPESASGRLFTELADRLETICHQAEAGNQAEPSGPAGQKT